jgi:putative ABC transport system permease protein
VNGRLIELALRGVRARRMKSWLTVVGVLIGVSAIVALISIGAGVRNAVLNQFEEIGYDIVVIRPNEMMSFFSAMGSQGGPSPGGFMNSEPGTLDPGDLVNRMPELVEAESIRTWTARVSAGDTMGFLRTVAWTQGFMDTFGTLIGDFELTKGKGTMADSKSEAVLGARCAANLGVGVGNSVVIDGESFAVIGILSSVKTPSTNSEVDFFGIPSFGDVSVFGLSSLLPIEEDSLDDALFVSSKRARELWGQASQPTTIVRVAPGESVDMTIDKIRAAYASAGIAADPTSIEELADDIQATVGLIEAVLASIAAVALLVGGIGLMNTMYVSVLERTREIGILKAVGARASQILLMFLIDSGLMGLIGGLLGLGAGVGLSLLGTRFIGPKLGVTTFSPMFASSLIFGVLGLSLVLGALAGAWPAWRASRLQPVVALSAD